MNFLQFQKQFWLSLFWETTIQSVHSWYIFKPLKNFWRARSFELRRKIDSLSNPSYSTSTSRSSLNWNLSLRFASIILLRNLRIFFNCSSFVMSYYCIVKKSIEIWEFLRNFIDSIIKFHMRICQHKRPPQFFVCQWIDLKKVEIQSFQATETWYTQLDHTCETYQTKWPCFFFTCCLVARQRNFRKNP